MKRPRYIAAKDWAELIRLTISLNRREDDEAHEDKIAKGIYKGAQSLEVEMTTSHP